MFKTHLLFILLSFSLLFTASCTEMELASHVAKQTPIAKEDSTQGRFKVGTPYKVAGKWYEPRETYSFEQTGIASWYGPKFHGKKTANGETFDMFELTAAHKTLQMASLVRVTNLENGRSIVVRVNDRGPFSKGRVIDLSKRSAELLGFINQGTAKVKLQLLADESKQIAEAAKRGQDTRGTEIAMNTHRQQRIDAPDFDREIRTAPPRPTQTASLEGSDIQTSVPGHVERGKFYPDPIVKNVPVSPNAIYVQAGSFSDPNRANALARAITTDQANVVTGVVNGQKYYRVRIGPVPNAAQADAVLNRLASIGQDNAIVVVD